MNINPITYNQNFEGKVILKNKISKQQNYLLNRHKPTLENMIKDLPFDLFIEQSKSKRTIALSTSVKGANTYFVRKNEQDFEEAANYAINDAKEKSEEYKALVKANEIMWFVKLRMLNIIDGNIKEAREISKKIAELGIKDFDIYKKMINFKITGFPLASAKTLFINSIKYKIYNAFSKKTPAEKQLLKMNKEYIKKMKAENIKIEPIEIDIRKSMMGYYNV